MVRESKEYHLKGSIINKDYIKKYQGRLKGQGYYELKVELTKNTKPAIFGGTIQAIREKILDDNIWNDIIEDNWIDKKYLFTCYKYGYIYRLIRWKEILPKTKL